MDLTYEQAKRLAAVLLAEDEGPEQGAVGSGVGSPLRVPPLIIALTLGAIVTVLIAWHAALCAPFAWTPVNGSAPKRPATAPTEWGDPLFVVSSRGTTMRAIKYDWSRTLWLANTMDNGSAIDFDTKYYVIYSVGWPLPAFRWSAQITESGRKYLNPRMQVPSNGNRNAIITGLSGPAKLPFLAVQPNRRLPLTPLWGFVPNTLVFAAAFALLLYSPRSIRTHLRRRRNLCPRCAYSLANLPTAAPCPECGHVNRAG